MTVDTISVLLDGPAIQQWEYDALHHLVNQHDASIPLVIIRERDGWDCRKRIRTLLDGGSWGVYSLYRQVTHSPTYRQMRSLQETELFENSQHFNCKPLPSAGLGIEFPDEIVNKVEETDITVRFGFGIIKGDILDASEYGVLSYHHGNLRKYRGRPAGFWEFLNGETQVGVTVQRLSETLDGGDIAALIKVDISEATSLPEVQRRIFEASPPLLADAASAMIDGETETPQQLGDLYHTPGLTDLVRYLLKVTSCKF